MKHQAEGNWILVKSGRHGEANKVINGVVRFDRKGIWWNFVRLKKFLDTVDLAFKSHRYTIHSHFMRHMGNPQFRQKFQDANGEIDSHRSLIWKISEAARMPSMNKYILDMEVLNELLGFLEGKWESTHPYRNYIWIPGIANIPQKYSRVIIRLHGLLADWYNRNESRGTPLRSILAPSNIKKAQTLRQKGWSVPKIVAHLHPKRWVSDEQDALLKRYQRVLSGFPSVKTPNKESI